MIEAGPESSVVIPDDLAARIGVSTGGRQLRIAYIPGPGDVFGTYRWWRRGQHDPALPVVAYSTMFYELCRQLDARALIIQRTQTDDLRDRLDEDRFTFVHVAQPPGGLGILSEWWSQARFSAACLGPVRTFSPDVVILGGSFFGPFIPFLRARRGSKIVLSIHNALWPPGASRISIPVRIFDGGRRIILRAWVDGAVGVSGLCGGQFKRLAGERRPAFVSRIQLKREDLDRGVRRLRAREEARREDGPLIAFVGRIEVDKGVFDLLSAFCMVAERHPSLCLAFAGEGDALERLRSAAAATAFADRITCLGRLDGAGVHALLGEAAVLVCPTRTSFVEGFPAVCFEALANGAPVLLSSAVPSPERLGDAGAVFPAEDPAGLSHVIDSVLSDRARLDAMRAAAGRLQPELYDASQSWGSAMARLLGAVLSPAGKSGSESPGEN